MRVFHINSYSNGSTGKIATAIHEELINQGSDSCFAYGLGETPYENCCKITNPRSMLLHAYTTMLTGLHGYFSSHQTLALINKIKAFHPDIVHLHNLHGGYINVFMLLRFLKKSDIKTVITLHDCWLFTGKCYHFYEAGCNRWTENCGNCPQLSMYPKSIFFDRTKKMLKDKRKAFKGFKSLNIVAVSDWLRDTAKQSFLNEYEIRTIHNGIDTSLFYPRTDFSDINKKYKLSDKFVILGVASSWNEHKGLADFLRLSEMLDENEVIVLVGVTDEQKELLPKNIIGISRTENSNELADLYSRADVFLNCSTEETFGLVVAEAMACATPAIVYDATACGEILDEGTGFVVQPHDIKKVYDCIAEIKKGKTDYKTNCVSKICNDYKKEIMVKKYIDLYFEV